MNIKKIPNQIINGKLENLNLSKIDCIVLHHMAHKSADVKMVESWHINQGWSAIGYNYFIGFDGTIYEGRGYTKKSASVLNENGHIVSIGFQGDYENVNKTMPDAQFNSGVELIKWLKTKLVNANKVCGHRDFGGSVCPGKFFPLEEFKTLKLREENKEMIYNYIDDNMPLWARDTITKLVKKEYIKGNEKGELGLNETMLRIFVCLDRAGLFD